MVTDVKFIVWRLIKHHPPAAIILLEKSWEEIPEPPSVFFPVIICKSTRSK